MRIVNKDPIVGRQIDALKRAAKELARKDIARFAMVLRRWVVATAQGQRRDP
jgi:hypothetical protein